MQPLIGKPAKTYQNRLSEPSKANDPATCDDEQKNHAGAAFWCFDENQSDECRKPQGKPMQPLIGKPAKMYQNRLSEPSKANDPATCDDEQKNHAGAAFWCFGENLSNERRKL